MQPETGGPEARPGDENLVTEAPRVLIVDDDRSTQLLLSAVVTNGGYLAEVAGNGEEGLARARENPPDAILLDLIMPGMNGIEVCRCLRQDPELQRVPIILITADGDPGVRLEGLQAGAMDFVSKPPDDVELLCRIGNLVRVKQMQDALVRQNERLEERIRDRTAELQNAIAVVEDAYGRLRDMTLESIYRLSYAAEYRDEDTAAHTQRIAHYARAVAEALGWPEDRRELIFYSSPMHDIGKIGIPDNILLKEGTLSLDEQKIMRQHTVIGARLLSGSLSPVLQMAEHIAASHHEAWDGTGYPLGLRGEEIPIEGRIVMICDVYDALRSQRPYKPAYDHDATVEVISTGEGRARADQFDPTVRQAFLDLATRMGEIFEEFADYPGLPPVDQWLAKRQRG